MLGHLAVVAVAYLLAVAPLVFATTSQVNISGSYRSSWGDVRLSQDGNRVDGTYVCCGGGTIEGRIIEDRTIRYLWRQPGGWGQGVWTIGAGKLDGTWGVQHHESDGGRWDLVEARGPRKQIAN